jgi:hypothetical protein
MDKRRVQRTKRAARTGGNLPAAMVGRVEAARVVGGETKQAQTLKPPAYL